MDEDQVMEWEDAIPSQPEDKYDWRDKLVNPDFEYYDDKAKLLANSLTGGIYDLGQLMWEGNPLEFVLNDPTGLSGQTAEDKVDFPGLGEWAFSGLGDLFPGGITETGGWSPFRYGDGTFFDYDAGFKPFNQDPEYVEGWGRLISQLGVPVGGIFSAPQKAAQVTNILSKALPSIKYFQDIGNMNVFNRIYRNAYKMAEKIKGKGNVTKADIDEAIKKSQWFINKPTKFKRGWNTFVDQWAKPWGQMFTRPFNPMNWLGRKKQLPKFPGDKMPPPGKFTNPRWVKPEITYAKNAARNWALATGAKYGIEGIKSLVDRHPNKFDRYSYEGEFDMGSAAPYEDKIMKMAKSNKPKIGIQFSDGPMYWG
tara:strand:- start:1486 stop:2583 length:1098 start_codon:yes stop_codon:yes gene_type:complete